MQAENLNILQLETLYMMASVAADDAMFRGDFKARFKWAMDATYFANEIERLQGLIDDAWRNVGELRKARDHSTDNDEWHYWNEAIEGQHDQIARLEGTERRKSA